MTNYENALMARIDEYEFAVEEAEAMDYSIPVMDTSDMDESFDQEASSMRGVFAGYFIYNDGHTLTAHDWETGKIVAEATNAFDLWCMLEGD